MEEVKVELDGSKHDKGFWRAAIEELLKNTGTTCTAEA